jgi:hypothetical protein
MNRPPMLMHVKIHGKDANFGIWLPLFLLIPLALVILIVLSPLILIALLILWPSGWGRFAWQSFKVACASLWAMRGLKVDVQGRDGVVDISVI